ncbi:MAG: prolipoprotein diacylglyceryl transferase [Helicobacter sp.]|nr:prolipoprotein diacylglyceryl transferase [Helicobacter sp.]
MFSWRDIYAHFDPVAFNLFGISVHWYGIAYAIALILTLYIGKFFISKSPKFFTIDAKTFENYFITIEIGVILGARLGYVLIYDPNSTFYLLHPWQIFNPFDSNGSFIGISGMSYHGGVIGLLIASFLFCKFKKISQLMALDLVAISVPLAYVFGRIGNFLNQELFGRQIGSRSPLEFLGILVNNKLVYPSQLIEAFLEGICIFIIIFFVWKKIAFKSQNKYGILIALYGILYAFMRFVAEFFREPDPQLGFYGVFSMGQILSLLMALGGVIFLIAVAKRTKNKAKAKATFVKK